MKNARIVSIAKSDQVGLYSICFNDDKETEFRKFLQKFKDNAALNKDYQAIIHAIDRIIANGALERNFRYEGKMNDNVVALPVVQSKLRLYCLRLSDKILILGNGGKKRSKTYEEDNELSGYVLTLQNFDQLIKEGVNDGSIIVTENKIETDKTFDL